MNQSHILVVDDEPDIRSLVQEILADEGFKVAAAADADTAQQLLETFKPDLVLLDIWMPNVDGITLLKKWKEHHHLLAPIVMMSGHGNVETAVEATRHGAYDFLEKPLSIAKLLLTVKHALESVSLQQEKRQLNAIDLAKLEPIGKSVQVSKLREQLLKIANHATPILMYGESGTEKELYARYLHSLSSNKDGAFITINVATINAEQAQITSLNNDSKQSSLLDYFAHAAHGTLFIKDIAELDPQHQSALHDALEAGQYKPLDAANPLALNMRIIAATRFNIEAFVAQERFRSDLFYQLNVIPIAIPALREHYEDIPSLLEYYVNYFIETEGLPYRHFSIAAQNHLRGYAWPGNIRELKNLIQRLLILGTKEVIDVDEIEAILCNNDKKNLSSTNQFNFDLPLRDAREHFEKAYFEYQLKKVDGSVSKVANRVGIERTHLYRKLKTLGIDLK